MESYTKGGSLLTATLLVAGCCVGGGMLALPLATGVLGLAPTLTMMLITWLAMTATGLAFVEMTLWYGEGAHVITLAKSLLGSAGRLLAWLLYLYIAYASLVAYTAEGGNQLGGYFSIGQASGCVIYAALFGAVLYLGNQLVGRVNTLLFGAKIIAFLMLIGIGLPEVNPTLFLHQRWSGATFALPLLLTAFSFQTMVPSLVPYLNRDTRKLRFAIIAGTAIAFLTYLVWVMVVMGIVPLEGPNGLEAAAVEGRAATYYLQSATNSVWIQQVSGYFSFFALATSFLAIAMGLFDFLSDGLKVPRKGKGELLIAVLVMVPVLFFAINYERIFILALETSGGIGDTLLNGLLPLAMLWIGRYRLNFKSERALIGGKGLILILALFYAFSFGQEIASLAGWSASTTAVEGTEKIINIK